jgi:hypothetical protein
MAKAMSKALGGRGAYSWKAENEEGGHIWRKSNENEISGGQAGKATRRAVNSVMEGDSAGVSCAWSPVPEMARQRLFLPKRATPARERRSLRGAGGGGASRTAGWRRYAIGAASITSS